jgi:Nucleotidyl transferase AbiEii toxin, Type IV TA system
MAELSLPEKVVAIDEGLKDARIPHAFGGALALAYYAEPRVTIDIDVNVFVPTTRIDEIDHALTPLGVAPLDADEARSALERDGQCRIWWGITAVDLFFSYTELHEAMRRDARRVPFGDDEIDVLSPEHLVVCKASFDRPKDWLDIEQVLVATDPLEVEEVDFWLREMLGEDDHRKQRFDELVAELRD